MRSLIFVFFVFIAACEGLAPLPATAIAVEEIELIDTFTNLLFPDTSAGITEADFHPMYIGEKKAAITLEYYVGQVKAEYTGPEHRFRLAVRENDIKIYVDTAQLIGSTFPYDTSEEFELKRGPIQSYPVFVENLTEDTLRGAVGEYVPLLIEAQDSTGQWRRIQKNYIYYCGTDMVNYYIPPRQILLTNCKLYAGAFRTRLRLVDSFGTNFSNEFWGAIDYRQFEELQEEYPYPDSEF